MVLSIGPSLQNVFLTQVKPPSHWHLSLLASDVQVHVYGINTFFPARAAEPGKEVEPLQLPIPKPPLQSLRKDL